MTADLAPDALHDLLPVVYRLRDLEHGAQLQAFLRIVAEQAEILKRDIDRLWDDLAIETCQPWVVPYIGDLVGNNLLHDAGARTRVDVARTIFYRRRKGTLPILEQLARDVTGWGGHAVPFFELLGWTQHLNHLRPASVQTPDLRDLDRLDRLDGPFDEIAHTVDVRPPSGRQGRHNLANVGFFLYRLGSYPLRRTQARQAANGFGYHFSSLGAPTRLFNRWRREGDEAGLAGEAFVPGPIRPLAFQADLDRFRADLAAGRSPVSDYVGRDDAASLAVYRAATPEPELVPPEQVRCMDLTDWGRPPDGLVGVDVRLGRIAFAAGDQPPDGVLVDYHYGFADDTGGGPYDRRRPATAAREDREPAGANTVADPTALGTLIQVPSPGVESIQEAVDLWRSTSANPPTVIQIEDDRTYVEDLTIPMAGDRLVIQAANRRRPTLVGRIEVARERPAGRLTLDGLLVEGWLVCTGDLGELRLRHCTLVPGRALDEAGRPAQPEAASLVAEAGNRSLRVVLERTITGPLRLPENALGLVVRDAIVDGLTGPAICAAASPDESGPPTELQRSTVFGAVHVRELTLASEVIFTAPVRAERTGSGCVRFSHVPADPETRVPRRYRCQPDLALATRAAELGKASVTDLTTAEQELVARRVRPRFTSERYGEPGYAQLASDCPREIAAGAEDGSEMGGFAGLRQPQRETNLRIRLDEYLPVGLHAALIHVT
jgi:hypothetical protein